MDSAKKFAFRPDIEGLRCIAVIAVLLYHLDPDWLPGGFQGVDIFFVISGYLITGLISRQGSQFSFRQFYLRRFWRLFPSLACVIGLTIIASYFVLSPYDYVTLSASAVSALAGLSNFFFYVHLDYFTDDTLVHPLLHTWSLGVEEQLYLFWPVLIVVMARRLPLLVPMAVLLVCGSGFNWLVAPQDPQLAFYMMPFRVFEFAAGATLFASEHKLPEMGRTVPGAAGAALVAYGLLAIDENHVWPGAFALFPVLGTTLLLWAGRSGAFCHILGNTLFGFIGRISYVLYLVHWPVIVLYRYWRVLPLSVSELAALASISIFLAVIIHIGIETPFRAGRPSGDGLAHLLDIRRFAFWQRSKAVIFGIGASASLALALVVWVFDGLPGRVSSHRAQRPDNQLSYAGDICAERRSRRCVLGDPTGKRLVFVVGDSHAGNLFFGLDSLFRGLAIKGIGIIDHGCPFLFGTTRFLKGKKDEKCGRNIADTFDAMARTKAPVILAVSYEDYRGSIGYRDSVTRLVFDKTDFYSFMRSQLIEGMKQLDAENRPVLLVKSSYNSGINVPRCLTRPGVDPELLLRNECRPKSLAEVRELSAKPDSIIDEVASRFARVSSLDPKRGLCEDQFCTVMENGAFLMRDTSHLTNEGSLYLTRRLRAEIVGWLNTVSLRAASGAGASSHSSD